MVAAVWVVNSEFPCGQRVELSDTFRKVFVLSFGQSNLPLQQSNQTFSVSRLMELVAENSANSLWQEAIRTFPGENQTTHTSILILISYNKVFSSHHHWYMICNSAGEFHLLALLWGGTPNRQKSGCQPLRMSIMIQSLLASVQPLIILVSGDLARTGMDEHVSVENQRKDKGDCTKSMFLFVVLLFFSVTRDEVKRLQCL